MGSKEEYVNSLKVDELIIVVEGKNPTRIKWLGASQLENPTSEISPFFEELAKRLQGDKVVVDFCNLERMNSATVLAIVNLCRTFDKNTIQTEIQYDKSIDWQSVTFEGISTLSKVMTNVTVEPKAQ
jgi:hypothetical protein